MWIGPCEWRACETGETSENRLVSLVYVVCLICLVELDEPDEPVPRGYPAGSCPIVPNIRTIGFPAGRHRFSAAS